MHKSHKNDACISLKDFSYFSPISKQIKPISRQLGLYIYLRLIIWVSVWTEWWKQLGPCLTGNHQLLERLLWMKACWAPRGKEEATTHIRTGKCRSELRHWCQRAHLHAMAGDSSFMQCYLGTVEWTDWGVGNGNRLPVESYSIDFQFLHWLWRLSV